MFPGRESKQPAAKAKEKVEAFAAEGEEVRRRPRERVRCYSLGVSPVAARWARSKGNAEVETEQALLVTERASVGKVRHTVDGDLLENFTRVSRKIEVAETESQLNLRVGSGILGERLWAAGAPRDFLDRFSFGRSSTVPQARDLFYDTLNW